MSFPASHLNFCFLILFFAVSALAENSGSAILNKAVNQCKERHLIDANLRVSMNIFGDKYTGEGFYREQCPRYIGTDGIGRLDRRKTQYRLELNRFKSILSVKPGSAITVTYDLDHVWLSQSIDGKRAIKRVNAEKLIRFLQEQKKDLNDFDMSEMPSLGGLKGFLMQIERFFIFADSAAEISVGSESDKFDAYKIRGKINPDKFLSAKGIPIPLPAFIPNEIDVLIGKEDFFPYHFEFYLFENNNRTLLFEVILENVQHNTDKSIAPSLFTYWLGTGEFIEDDFTEEYLDILQSN